MVDKYVKENRLYELVCGDYSLLQVLSRFSMPLGFGDKTIEEICKERGVDCDTFLAVINFSKEGILPANSNYHINLNTLSHYLKQAHSYYLDFLLPFIRRKLIEALGFSPNNDISLLIIKFYDEYCLELKKHMKEEEENVFPYVESLLEGKKIRPVSFEMSVMQHQFPQEQKLGELKNIMIKYYSSNDANNLINSVLYDIFIFEEDLVKHCALEKYLFVPEVKRLEENISNGEFVKEEDTESYSESLTEREKEIITCVVKGYANKEIADKLCISINTVTTHRRNIAKKLNIHSPSGLTIYAIVNKLVDVKDIKQ